MSERPKRAGLVVRLLVALTVVGLVFGGGVLVGWATRERRPPARSKSVEPVSAEEVKKEIAACRSELKALAEARSTPPSLPPGETDDAGLESAAKVEALRTEVKECRVRDTLQNAYVCGTISDHISLYHVLVHGTPCMDPPGIGEHLLNSVDKCAEFHESPAHLEKDELTRSEQDRVAFSQMSYRARTKENVVGWMERVRLGCRRIWMLPPE